MSGEADNISSVAVLFLDEYDNESDNEREI